MILLALSLFGLGGASGAPVLDTNRSPRLDLLDAPWRAFGAGDFPDFGPVEIAQGDLDGDGLVDVVLAREYFGSPGISVLLAKRDGTFQPPRVHSLPFNQSARGVALADMDLDGHLDVLVTIPDANGLSAEIGVWRNDGTGGLVGPSRFPTGPGPIGIAVADFDGNGFPDVVTAESGYVAGSTGSCSVLLHNGRSGAEASFLAPVTYDSGDDSAGVAVADIDGDGDVDFAVGRGNVAFQGGGIEVFFNEGSGTFQGPISYDQAPGAFRTSSAVALADVDGDGDPDLIGGGAENSLSSFGFVSILRNDGTGVFGAPEEHSLGGFSFTPRSFRTADLDGDGWLDLVATTPSGRTKDGFVVMLSNGEGGYRAPVLNVAAKETYDVGFSDVDHDGDLDALSVANDSSVVTVHRNAGDGSFPALSEFPVGALSDYMDAGDIDHDGDVDVVTSDSFVRILRNRGDGIFAPFTTYVTPFNLGEVRLRDLNGDGFLDLLMGPDPDFPPYDFATALNLGNGTFGPSVVTKVFACQGGQIDAFDLDEDGDLDVVLTEPGACAGQTSTNIYLARNEGDGQTFTLLPPLVPPGLAMRIGGADFDHDGHVDLITNTSLGITVFRGRGNFTFRAGLFAAVSAFDFAMSDLDRDGNEDVCALLPQPSFGTVVVATLRGLGDGTFGAPRMRLGPNGREGAFRISNAIDAGDLDGDGLPDVVLTNDASNDVSVFLGRGDGSVSRQQRYGAAYAPRFTAVADFDGDGRDDIASLISLESPASGANDAVVVLRGQAPRR